MRFLHPAMFWFLLSVPVIILLHFALRKRKTVTVASTVLWQAVVAENKRSIRFRFFIYNTNLILQILLALFLTAALARPVTNWFSGRGEDLVVVIDRSASMNADDGEGPRLEVAKQILIDRMANLSPSSRVLIIGASSEVEVLSGYTSDLEYAAGIVTSIEPSDAVRRPSDAIIFALNLIEQRDAGRTENTATLVILTDAAFDPLATLDLSHVHTEVFNVGAVSNNAGITAFKLRQTPDESAYEIYVRIENYGLDAVTLPIDIRFDDVLVESSEIYLEPKQEESLILRYTGLVAQRAMVHIRNDDALDVDNRAYAIVSASPSIKALLVSPGNLFLESALASYPSMQLTVTDQPIGIGDDLDSYDLVVIDRQLPPPLPDGRYLLVNTPMPRERATGGGIIEYPSLRVWAQDHPVMRGVEFGNITIVRSPYFPTQIGLEALAGTESTPLIHAYDGQDHRFIHIAFDVLLSDLPLRPAFPVLMGNAITWLYQGDLVETSDAVTAGTPILLSGQSGARVRRPDGRIDIPRDPNRYLGTEKAGVYTVFEGGTERLVAVNMIDPIESNIIPRALLSGSSNEAADGRSDLERSLWIAALAIVLLLLVLEWWAWTTRW